MRTRILLAILFCSAAATSWGAEPVCAWGTASVSFASQDEGRRILGSEDGFVRSLSAFDRAARLKSDKPVDTASFRNAVGAQALSWTPEEEREARTQVCDLAQKLGAKKWKLSLPAAVVLVKAASDVEGGAPHTRGAAIVLPNDTLTGRKLSARLLGHELFHILSRELARVRPAGRDALYGLVGYTPLKAPVVIPAEWRDRRITNPDSYEMSHGVKVIAEGKEVLAVPFLFATPASYDARKGGAFFDYLTFKLLALQKEGDSWVARKDGSGHPLLLEPMRTNYLNLVGRNTEELFQADEVLADNFTLALGYSSGAPVPNPELPAKLDALLR